MKVLVRFKGDNDFGRVLKAFGDLLLHRVREEPHTLTQEMIAGWFNTIATTLYEMTYGKNPARESRIRIEKYLQIQPNDVFIGLAADNKLVSAHEWANYDSVMIDGSEHAREKVYLV